MKNKILFLLSIISAICLLGADIPSFKKSWEAEFTETAEYFCNPKAQTLEDAKAQILADKTASKKRHYPDRLFSMDEMSKKFRSDNNEYASSLFFDFKKTFGCLKEKMGIPEEVDFIYCDDQSLASNAWMGYAIFDRTIYIYPNSSDICPSYLLFTMIHELTHTKQHMRIGMLKWLLDGQNELFHAQYEHEADINAAQSINCPLCMKAVLAYQLLREGTSSQEEIAGVRKDGYLMSDDLKKYLQQKSLSDLCKVHKSVESQNIWSGLDTKEGCMEIFYNDFNDSSMFNRLS